MLCGTRNSDSKKVFASESEKVDGPFSCPGCSKELIIRKGKIKVHHFSHKPPNSCPRGQGETEAHRSCKEAIYNSLMRLSSVSDLEVEKDFGAVISDIYFVVNGVKIAIEIQRSNLSVNEITQRTASYEKLGIHVLWLALFNDKLELDKYSPKAWEKWCHAAYYGRVYYWQADLEIVPVHFGEYQTYIEETRWYDSSGQEQIGGGFYKSSKRYRNPNIGKSLSLDTDFQAITKPSWSGGSVIVPKSRLYIDTLEKWW